MAYKQEQTRQVQLEDTVTDSTKKGVTANGIKQALENVQPAGNYARGDIYRYGDGDATIAAPNSIQLTSPEMWLSATDGDMVISSTGYDVIVNAAQTAEINADDIHLTARHGTVSLTSEDGDIHVAANDGAINVTTNNGDMNVEVDGYMGVEATGTLNLSSSNGNANLTAEESVTVRAQTQDLNLEAGENVNAKAGENGDLNIKKAFEGTGGSTVTETYPLFGEVLRERVEVEDTVANHALQANQLTIFTSRTSALTLTLAAGATHTEFILPKEYHFFIMTGATAPTVTFPASITWAGGAPTLAGNKTYEFSIQEGVAIGIEA